MTTYKMTRREDEKIKATAKTLELLDKYKLDIWKEVYIDISRRFAIKYKMDTLLEFLSIIISQDERHKD